MFEMNHKKQSGVIFKIEFEKAYNKIKWSSMKQMLQMKGFSPTWCQWIAAAFTQNGRVRIKINDQVGENFQTKKGMTHLVDNGLSILQYANDTLIFMDDNVEKANNLKLLFCAFKKPLD
jgi:hypothetical protein